MPMIKNDAVAVMADETGHDLRVLDLRRGALWQLDEASAVWGGRITTNDYPTEEGVRSLRALAPVQAAVENGALTVTCRAGDATVTFCYTLLDDGVEVRLPPPVGDGVEAVSMPGAFAPAGERMKLLLPIMQGMLWDGRGQDVSHMRRSGSHTGFAMMMYGVLGEHGGLLAAAETAVDSLWWYQKDARGFRVQNVQDGSLGGMRYERVIRFYLTDPGIVPLARRYRARVKERGRFASWEEKIAERPNVERLFGSLMCYLGYCLDDLDYVAELAKLRAYGFDRALVYPVDFNCYDRDIRMGGLPPIHLSREAVARVWELGFDVSPWTWINEAIDDGSAAAAGMYRINRDGSRIFGWQIDDQAWYKVCSAEMRRFEAQAVAGPFDHMTWDHFDVLTCAMLGECYAADHAAHPGRPLSREEDLAWLRQTLSTGKGAGGKSRAVSSESFNDLFSLEYDIGSVKAWPQCGPWAFWPVPLTGLVYHDSILHSWWEPHSYNSPYFNRAVGPDLFEYGGGRVDLQAATDALLGCPPDVFPFGAQYGWTGRGYETVVFRFRFEDPIVQYALARALPVAALHRRIGKLEMTDFEFLSEDGWVQRTAFADGTTVVANFGCNLRSDIAGVEPIMGQSWRVSGDHLPPHRFWLGGAGRQAQQNKEGRHGRHDPV